MKATECTFNAEGEKLKGCRLAVKRHLLIEVAQSVYEKCHEFQENDLAELGSATDWLAKATCQPSSIALITNSRSSPVNAKTAQLRGKPSKAVVSMWAIFTELRLV